MKLISREEIKTLVEQPRQNSISIYMPLEVAGSEVRQNSIRFKNLIRQAQTRLLDAGLDDDEVTALIEKAHQLDETSFWEETGDRGLAVFISQDIYNYYTLPIEFEELVVVTDRFHIKPLLQILNNDGRFYLLTLSQKEIKFFEGTRYSIREVEVENMPKSLDEALGYDETAKEGQFRIATSRGGTSNPFSKAQPGAFHGQGSPDRDEHHKDILQFFYAVNNALEEKLRNQQAPLILAGVEYLLPLYREASSYKHLVEEAIAGNTKVESTKELHDQAWPIVEGYFQQSQRQVVERFNELFGANAGKASNNISEIAPAAYYQKIDSLLVAVGKQQWGLFNPGTETVFLHEEEETGDEDLLDFAAAHTLLNGGTVYTVPPEQVPYSSLIAAIFRY